MGFLSFLVCGYKDVAPTGAVSQQFPYTGLTEGSWGEFPEKFRALNPRTGARRLPELYTQGGTGFELR